MAERGRRRAPDRPEGAFLAPDAALASPPMRALVLLAPLLLAACVGYATPERTVLFTPVGVLTEEHATPDR